MIDKFNTREEVQALFPLSSDEDQFALVYSTFPTGALVLGGAGTAMTANVDQAYGGYLVRISKAGLDLYPLSKVRQSNGLSTPSRMKLAQKKIIHLDRSSITSAKNRPANGISPWSRTLTLTTKNGKRYVWQVNKKEGALPYHACGYQALVQFLKS